MPSSIFRLILASLTCTLAIQNTASAQNQPTPPAAHGSPLASRPLMWQDTYPMGLRTAQAFALGPNGRLLMFGGTLRSASSRDEDRFTLGDLWEWDGTRWRGIDAAGPGPRAGAAMALNPVSGRVMLFGGYGRVPEARSVAHTPHTENRSDTWEWDGVVWRQLQSEGPSPAFSFGSHVRIDMAFDASRGTMVLLIPGQTATGAQTVSTWEWSGSAWVRKHHAERQIAFPCFDSQTGTLIARQISDAGRRTLQWTGSDWVPVAAAEPEGFQRQAFAADLLNGRVYAFSETWPSVPSRLWKRDAGVWVPQPDLGPFPAIDSIPTASRFAWDHFNDALLTMGGATSTSQSLNTFLLKNGVRTPVAPVGPGARTNPAVAYDPVRGVTVVAGSGIGNPQNPLPVHERRQTWEFDGTSWLLANSTTLVGTLHYDPQRQSVFTYNASASPSAQGQRLDWTSSAFVASATTNPPNGRAESTAAYHDAIGRLVLFGGRPIGAGPVATSSWLLDHLTWTELAIPGPSPRESHFMTYDSDRARIVLFGGWDTVNNRALSDTWEFDGTAWTQVHTGLPVHHPDGRTPIDYMSMTYDPTRRRTLLHSGANVFPLTTPTIRSTTPGAIWEWDGQTWTRREPVLPVRPVGIDASCTPSCFQPPNHRLQRLSLTPGFTFDGRLAFDPRSGVPLLWGGRNLVLCDFSGPISVAPAMLRELPGPVVIAQPPSVIGLTRRAVAIEARIAMENADLRWHKNGVPLTDDGRVTGTDTDEIHITNLRRSDAGSYTLVATGPAGERLETAPGTLRVRSIADLNNDGSLNAIDLTLFIGAFGRSFPSTTRPSYDLYSERLSDLDENSKVDVRDLIRLLGELREWNE
ncbi:MAG: hypothetical protein ACKVZJ_05415 [Phycisphaerales bacterium]